MTYREMFEAELERLGIEWCRGGCHSTHSHRRGFAGGGIVHLDSEVATRSTFHRALHETGHVVLGHVLNRGKRRYEIEAEANRWAENRMRELGVPVPRKEVAAGRDYVARMKRHGDASQHRHAFNRLRSDGLYVFCDCGAFKPA